MTTTAAAATHKAGQAAEKDKEKVEKRRALGRGLDSLLPGPRAVPGTAPVVRAAVEAAAPAADVRAELRSAEPPAPPTHSSSSEGPEVGATPQAAVPPPHRPTPPVLMPPQQSTSLMAQQESRVPGSLVIQVALADIDKNPFQTRYVHQNEALEQLADSIRVNGVVQPIVVRPAQEEGRYVLILGERRLHASKLAGKETIPAIVRRVSDQQAAEMTIIENLQREDLSPLEQAEAFRVLSEEFKMTQSQIGERIGLSRESVANYMRLLRLPEATMKLLAAGDISFATAKELLKLEDKDMIAKAAAHIVEKGMTFDQVERMVWQMMSVLDPVSGLPGQEKKKSGARWVDPNVRAAQTELERLLGVKVKIRDRKGKGKIVIEYHTVDDYERVVGMLRGNTA